MLDTVHEQAADERTEEAKDAEGLHCSTGMRTLPEKEGGCGRGVVRLLRGSGSSDSALGVAILSLRTGVCWSMVSQISPQRRFRAISPREESGRSWIWCMM